MAELLCHSSRVSPASPNWASCEAGKRDLTAGIETCLIVRMGMETERAQAVGISDAIAVERRGQEGEQRDHGRD